MATTLTPNMQLPVPSVGTEPGPQYASDINSCLTILDGHDHSPGYGTAISPAGMNINADLSFIGNNAIDLRTVRLSPQTAAPSTPSDLGCLYELGVDLYFKDGSGNAVRITQSGAVAGTPGSIANLVSPASASYSAAAKTFTFQSDALTPGHLDGGSVVLRNIVASSPGLTLSPPTLSGDYTITLPTLPGSTLPLQISSGGTITAAQITTAQLEAAIQAKLALLPPAAPTPPVTQTFTSGSGTYTKTAGALYIEVEAVGGGGGGSGNNGSGSAGADTTFGSSLITCAAGSGAANSVGGAGGTATATGLTGTVLQGAGGQGGPLTNATFANGGSGGASPFGGAGAGGPGNGVAKAAIANTGSGGGGAGNLNNGLNGGGGGGAGGYVKVIITSPSSTYAYAVGGGGSAAGSGSAGASGFIKVTEYFQ